ncbi:MAG: PadR family transcriptional regulator [Candidatus Dormibacteraeota bacterium]|nr:PadR family transcriptional regulator [Candidatus Dormibacteraeota bacterium]
MAEQSLAARRDLVALTILALLSEQPRHPYEMQRLIRERRKDFALGSARGLYHRVASLARRGFIEVAGQGREGHRPERTTFRITDAGRDEFRFRLLDLLATPAAGEKLFAAAVSFLGYVDTGEAATALESRRVELEAAIAGHETALASLQGRLRLPRIVLVELEYAVAMRRAECAWVASIVTDLRAGRLPGLDETMFAAHNDLSRMELRASPNDRPQHA